MSPANSNPLPGAFSGRVIKVTDKTAQDATGAWVAGEVVTYQLDNGQSGSIWIAKSEATPESVKAAVVADAQRLGGIVGITF